jgi:hypothetical protein
MRLPLALCFLFVFQYNLKAQDIAELPTGDVSISFEHTLTQRPLSADSVLRAVAVLSQTLELRQDNDHSHPENGKFTLKGRIPLTLTVGGQQMVGDMYFVVWVEHSHNRVLERVDHHIHEKIKVVVYELVFDYHDPRSHQVVRVPYRLAQGEMRGAFKNAAVQETQLIWRTFREAITSQR